MRARRSNKVFDDSADARAMRIARIFLGVIALTVVATIGVLVWASVPFGALWIGAAAILLLLIVSAAQLRLSRPDDQPDDQPDDHHHHRGAAHENA